MKKVFLLIVVLLFPLTEHFNTTEVYAQTKNKRIYSCAYDGFVNMREGPSFSAKKVGRFCNGPQGAIMLGAIGEWIKIDVAGTIGYVPKKYTQETPTIEYTGDVTVDWIEGLWTRNGSILMVHNNGTWEKGYDYPQFYGTYIMQNNEVKFHTIEQNVVDTDSQYYEAMMADWIEPICIEENCLGDWKRATYVTSEELEELGESEDGYALGYGAITEKDFKSAGLNLREIIESEVTPLNRGAKKKEVHGCIYIDGTPHLVNSKEDIETLLQNYLK